MQVFRDEIQSLLDDRDEFQIRTSEMRDAASILSTPSRKAFKHAVGAATSQCSDVKDILNNIEKSLKKKLPSVPKEDLEAIYKQLDGLIVAENERRGKASAAAWYRQSDRTYAKDVHTDALTKYKQVKANVKEADFSAETTYSLVPLYHLTGGLLVSACGTRAPV